MSDLDIKYNIYYRFQLKDPVLLCLLSIVIDRINLVVFIVPMLFSKGKAVVISEVDEREHNDLFRANGFSGYASDRISVNRSVPDIRHKGCQTKLYRAILPTGMGVIYLIDFFKIQRMTKFK